MRSLLSLSSIWLFVVPYLLSPHNNQFISVSAASPLDDGPILVDEEHPLLNDPEVLAAMEIFKTHTANRSPRSPRPPSSEAERVRFGFGLYERGQLRL